MEAAHFENGDIAALAGAAGDLFEKLARLLATSADLAAQHDFAIFVAEIHGELLAMQVDSQIQHESVLLG